MKFYVWGKSKQGPNEIKYLCDFSAAGFRLVPYAESLVVKFDTLKEANKIKKLLASRYLGMTFHARKIN